MIANNYFIDLFSVKMLGFKLRIMRLTIKFLFSIESFFLKVLRYFFSNNLVSLNPTLIEETIATCQFI